jgi:hypothetical protein
MDSTSLARDEPDREDAARRRGIRQVRRRAIANIVVGVLLLAAFVFGWLLAGLSGWFVVLGILIVAGMAGNAGFTYRWTRGAQVRVTVRAPELGFNAVLAIAAGLVIAQLSLPWLVGWGFFVAVWLGAPALIWLRAMRRSAPSGPNS